MAFNPFRAFRKHQKVFFAGLTILCMVTFVMCGSMGQGDFFGTIANVFTGRSRASAIATLYGKDISAKEIQDLRSQRRLASQYLAELERITSGEAVRSALEASSKWEKSESALVQQTLFSLARVNIPPQRDPRLRQLYFQALDQSLSPLYQLRDQFQRDNKTDQADVVGKLIRGLHHEFKQMLRPRTELYFGDTNSLEDVLDFMIWRHEADRRGIQLNRQDISELVLRETASESIDRSIQRNIEENLRRDKNFSPESFRTALADEFRVRIAKSALLGDDQANRYLMTWATPYEFWNFYKDNRTENTVAVLPIPARHKDFLAQVGQPSEKDLKDLFEKHKDQEYQAESPEPGFKIPPRIEVEWVSAKADSEHYRKEAQRTAGLIQAGFQVIAGGGQTMSGSVAADATTVAVPLNFDFSIIDKYERERYNLRNASWNEEWSKFFNPRLHETSIGRVDNAVAALGQVLGGDATQAPVLSGWCVFAGSACAHEYRDRAVIGLTTALAPTNPNPLFSAALTYYGSPHPQFIPLSEVKDQFAEKLQEDMAKKLVQTDLGELQNKLREESRKTPDTVLMSQAVNRPEVIAATMGQVLGGAGTGAPLALTTPTTLGPPAITNYVQARAREALVSALAGSNPSLILASSLAPLHKIRKTIDEAVKRYGLEHGSTRKPEDRDSIVDDPGLKAFKEAYLHDPQNRDPQAKNFAGQLFQNPVAYSPQSWPLGRGETDQGPSFLYWKINDKPAYVPPFAEVQDKVKDWWQLDKARELAKKEAEELKAKAQGQPDAERWLKDGTKHSEPMFPLDEVAGLVKPRTPFARGSSNSYQRYAVPPEKIEYAPEGLEKELVKMNEVGQVIVQSDRPKSTYYVFALVKRSQPSEHAFYSEYKSGPDSLLGAMDQETGYQAEYRKGITDQLRQEAHLKINDANREQVDEKQRSDE